MKYFSNLPVVNYNNTFVRNIVTRVKISDDFKKLSRAYYPYILKEATSAGLKYEHLAFDYYEDVEDVWLLFITNEVIDPYFDTPLNQQDFENYIIKKYNSIQRASQRILFYRNNFDQDDSILTESGYSSLSQNQKRYWTPTVNFNNQIIGYERQKDNNIISTNKIVAITLSTNQSLNIGERVVQNNTGASGEVAFSNTTNLTLRHIVGQFSNTAVITGDDSRISVTPTLASTLKQTLPDDEMVYYSPVTYYDYENELNEQKKGIQVIDSRFKPVIETKFRELMNNQ